jgi:hypothetical protein
VQDYFRKQASDYSYGGKYCFFDVYDEKEEKFLGTIVLRIAEHTENIRNWDRYNPETDYRISVVISDYDPTKKQFWSNDLERFSNEYYFSYDSDSTAEEIIDEIDGLLSDLEDQIRKEKSE